MRFLFDFIYPVSCVICRKKAQSVFALCEHCEKKLPWLDDGNCCIQCALPLQNKNLRCGNCLHSPPFFDQTIAAFSYQEPIAHFITALKFHQKLAFAKLLGVLLMRSVEKTELPKLIIPVPLHPQRLRERGYNQSLEIARSISKKLKIPIDYRSLLRIKATEPQSSLPAKKRHENMRGAFSIRKNLSFPAHVALVDDVMTTGNTINELSKILKKQGVQKISVWCGARAC